MPLRRTGKGPNGEILDESGKVQRTKRSLLSAARELRKRMTPAEKLLWNCLRRKSLGDFKFYRQVPVDRYIVDFYCPEKKLIIEVDGNVHLEKEQHIFDITREDELKDKGFFIMRFTNDEVLSSTTTVLQKIQQTCERI